MTWGKYTCSKCGAVMDNRKILTNPHRRNCDATPAPLDLLKLLDKGMTYQEAAARFGVNHAFIQDRKKLGLIAAGRGFKCPKCGDVLSSRSTWNRGHRKGCDATPAPDDLAEMYREGASAEALARDFGVSPGFIRRRLLRAADPPDLNLGGRPPARAKIKIGKVPCRRCEIRYRVQADGYCSYCHQEGFNGKLEPDDRSHREKRDAGRRDLQVAAAAP